MIPGSDDEDDSRADASGEIRLPATLIGSDGVLPDRAEIVIVGGGVMGLSIAYHLAEQDLDDVVVLERGYLAEGASGRNGGGVRQQWSTEINIRLMQESVELCRRFAVDLGVNVWFRQGGYLFLARNARELARLERNISVQTRSGDATRILHPAGAQQIVPELDLAGVVGAAYNPTDGILFPWPFLWGYARQAAAHGVKVFTQTPVGGLEKLDKGYVVRTPRGAIVARRVIDACGAWSPKLAAMIGVDVPTWPIRHEICSSEPLKPFLRPMVSELSSGLYCSQSMRGEIVGGVTIPGHGSTYGMGSTLEFLATYARRLVRLMPILGNVKVLRQWAGPYDQSPDGNPILGSPDGHPDFFLACGVRRTRLHDGADHRQALRRVADRWRAPRDLRSLHARAVFGWLGCHARQGRLQHRLGMTALADHTIGFIGAGNMAEAMIRGLVRGNHVAPDKIMASAPRAERLAELNQTYGIHVTPHNRDVVAHARLIVLSVKPQIADKILREIGEHVAPDTLLVSICAGVSTEAIEGNVGEAVRVIRAMPNTPALVGAGATAIAAGARASEADMATARALFDAVGITVALEEVHLDAVTGLSGSGPAYIFLILEALADAGVKVGLSRRNAQRLAAQTVMGSAKMLLETDEHPGKLKDMVTSPGGTAIAGLHTLEEGGLRTTLINAVETATKRSRELGRGGK